MKQIFILKQCCQLYKQKFQFFADVLISTGEGHGREKDAKVTIYKKTDETYMLKMKNSREFFSAVNKKHGAMPFNIRGFESETKAKMGVVECVTHKLVVPFQVLYEKEGTFTFIPSRLGRGKNCIPNDTFFFPIPLGKG